MLKVIQDALPEMVQRAVKEVLGIKDETRSVRDAKGVEMDKGDSIIVRNYEDFI